METIDRSNANYRRIITCPKCRKEKEHHSKGLCFNCYRKHAWKAPIVKCNHCGKERPHKAKGFCASCHPKLTNYEGIKAHNAKKRFDIPLKLYQELTKECEVCGFDKVIDLHHLDRNRKNNQRSNLIGLCPNHHRMIHHHQHSKGVVDSLTSKGLNAKIKTF